MANLERDRVQDGPMTYNETVQFVCDMIREVYPKQVFHRRRRFDTPVYQIRHPGLNEYIGSICKSIQHELHHSSIRQVVIAIHNEGATDACDALERYVFQLEFLLPETDVRNRDLVNLSKSASNLVARQFLLKILALDARLGPVGDGARTFQVLIEMTDDAVPTANSATDSQHGPWTPAQGISFQSNALDPDAKTTMASRDRHYEYTLPRLHPLQILDSGVINEYTRTDTQTSQESGWSSSGKEPLAHQATAQRDLDDPDIEQGVDATGGPLRKKKLFAQPLATGGPTSDASSDDSVDNSDN
ncbi:hypothetical protein MYAM1_003044 [Malassezia yamatoensis]|uniref:HORMA domain-containing protein n=1 Tax=Malassezia yamatoensis TaxID=253288 RepID=A0AAJ5YVN6_9BASI|nr:hypothetical protein MYAM1_003044 [Malassezia yamatoensis]